MRVSVRVALAVGFFLGLIGNVLAEDGRGWPRGGSGTGLANFTTSVNSPIGNFTFVDAGAAQIAGNIMATSTTLANLTVQRNAGINFDGDNRVCGTAGAGLGLCSNSGVMKLYSGATQLLADNPGVSATWNDPLIVMATSGNQFSCSGAAACNVASASGQTASLDCGGGTCTAQLGATNATTTSIGRAGQTTDIKGGTITMQGVAMDFTFCVYNTGNLAAASAFGETTFTHAVTVNTGSKIAQDVVGVGAGNFVVKLCTDGTTCAAGNTFLTYTEACTAVAGTRTAATVQNSGAIPAGAVGTISVTTACATTDPAANICVHYTMP